MAIVGAPSGLVALGAEGPVTPAGAAWAAAAVGRAAGDARDHLTFEDLGDGEDRHRRTSDAAVDLQRRERPGSAGGHDYAASLGELAGRIPSRTPSPSRSTSAAEDGPAVTSGAAAVVAGDPPTDERDERDEGSPMSTHGGGTGSSDGAARDDDRGRGAGGIHRRATRERYVELALLVAAVLVASIGDGVLAWVGLAVGGVAAVGFLYSTFRDPRIGPLAPCETPKTPAVLAVLLAALAVLQDPPERWVFVAFSAALVLNAVQAAVPRTTVRKVLDVAIVVAIAAGLAVIAVS